jgi:hypothetical protein
MIRAAIVVTRGDRDDVTASVASALDQTVPDVEVVVVDPVEGAAVGFGDPRARRIAAGGSGFVAEVNAALAAIRAPLVKIVPAGDRLAPQSIAAQAAALAARPDVGMVFSLVECVDATGRLGAEVGPYETAARVRDELLPALVGGVEIAIASALVRREVLVDQRGLDALFTTRAAAHDLWLRALPRVEALLLADRLARVRPPRDGDRVERAERALAQVRALEREGVERFLGALGGGPDAPRAARAAARLALADAMLGGDRPALLPFVHRLVTEASTLGAAVGSSRAARLAAAGLAGLSFGPITAAPPPSVHLPATEAEPGVGLAAARRRLARTRIALAAEGGASAALAELGRELSERIARPAAHEAIAPIDPRPLAEVVARIDTLGDEILARLRIGERLRQAVRRVLPSRTGSDARSAGRPTQGEEKA